MSGLAEHNREISLAVYPNPFNAMTTIGFTMDKPEECQHEGNGPAWQNRLH